MGRPKKKQQDKYTPTEEETKAMLWCIDRKIRVYPIPQGDEYSLTVEYVDNGRVHRIESGKTYPKDNWASTLYNLYVSMYNKNVDKL